MALVWAIVPVVPLLAAGPDDATQPPTRQVASEEIAGTILGLTPQGDYDEARLRVAGPAGYVLIKTLRAGAPIAVDLLNEATPRVRGDGEKNAGTPGTWASLPDGRYSYEAVFVSRLGERRSQSGMFFAENGSLVSREAMRARLVGVGEDLGRERVANRSSAPEPDTGTESDWFAIVDGVDDGIVYLSLDSDAPTANQYWLVANVNGDMEFHEDTNFTFPGTPRMTLQRGGFIGLGTTAPQGFIHSLTGSALDFIMESTAGGEQFIFNNTGSDTLLLSSNSRSSILNVAALGRVGVGVSGLPEVDFQLNNADATGDTVFKLVNAAEWNLGTTGTGVFTFNLAGSGGQEATFRGRNDPVATLDVQGHVRGTSFKSTSSRALKTAFEALDTNEILARFSELPVTSWRYKSDESEARHFGPMAEDFQQIFGLGDGSTISTVDADGVLMAALQGLNSKVEQQAAELRDKDAVIADLEARLATIEKILSESSQ